MPAPGDMVERLRPLVAANRARRQPRVRFRPDTWLPRLEPHGLAHVLDLGTEDPAARRPGDRLIGRENLTALRPTADDDTEGLLALFVAVMIWGSGTTNGRGPRNTAAALRDERLIPVLRTTREAVLADDPGRAYALFTVRGVGFPFFTKWFAALSDQALILDSRVLATLNALAWTTHEAATTRHWPTRYAAYVTAMRIWSAALDVPAPWLEWLLFDLNGHPDRLTRLERGA
ncbi:hypothetical protein RM780_20270 [Streptomyces sp. DSM 44917]|uniref:Uncharacterized protein n=1 Tax=Streptomyces boetiae TaxID=3075541 RepID=A0ABU2LDM0_9ACTN|nr:hypothetical protein [Streptomyces sp. DSM 44917]MDT0309278.1 hypothetical protein [Streptomyces sp. DSM 44917]